MLIVSKKYIVESGYVRSKNDSQIHWITCHDLMILYGVSPAECICNPNFNSLAGINPLKLRNFKILRPRFDGNYSVADAPYYIARN